MTKLSRATGLAFVVLAFFATVAATGGIALEARPAARAYVTPQQQIVSEAQILSFGLFGPESVFESEARRAAAVLRQWFGTEVTPIVRFNSKRGGTATAQSIGSIIRAAGAAMDPDKDVLVLVLTSHGSTDGLAIVAGGREDTLTPLALRTMLDASGAKYRVVIISACYSGVFVPALADSRTLVITAAAADRSSFGCEDGARWTYFGDAFFNQALRGAQSLAAAFETARRLVTARERREGFVPSRPQMAGGSEVLALLARR